MPTIVTVDEYASLVQNLREEEWLLYHLIQEDEVDLSTHKVSEPRSKVDQVREVRVAQNDEDVDIAVRSVCSPGAGAKQERKAHVTLGPECRS